MSIVTKSALASYFQTGLKPTQAQFKDLIDTLLNLLPDSNIEITGNHRNIVTFFYLNLADLPNANSFPGAIAVTNTEKKLYFSVGGEWKDALADEVAHDNQAVLDAIESAFTNSDRSKFNNIASGADVTGDNPPQAHNLGGSPHNADTLINLNTKISDLITTYGGLRDMGVGTLAQRPAFGTVNRFFWTTDEQKLYRDTGAAWEALATGGGASHSYGIIRSSSSDNGDFTDVQDWQGSGPFISEITHGLTIPSAQPFKLTPTAWQLVSGSIFKLVTPLYETVDNTKLRVIMPINSPLYMNII